MTKNVNLDFLADKAVAEVHSLSHDGRGIATIHHKTTFISGALPQETVTYQLTRKHGQYNEAHATAIVNASPVRVTPACPHFGICGGCSLQHMNTETQIQLKQQTVLDQLKHFGQVVPEVILPPLLANTSGYRHKARLGVKYVIKKNKVLVGFREKASRYLADIERCIVLHPSVGEQITALRELVTSLEQYQHIPQIEIAVSDNETALIFRHLKPFPLTDQEKLATFGQKYHFYIYLQPNPPTPVYQLWPENSPSRMHYTLPDYQLEMLFHPLDFTQINPVMNRLMVKQAVTLLELQPHENVLDLFCGMGNFTLPIALYARHVTGIEGNHEMVARAKENAAHNQIRNVDFYTANLQDSNLLASWAKKEYDKLLLDPPRTGAKEIMPLLPDLAAKKIVYVSCNPATLARDAKEIVHQHGYQLKKVGVVHMFPHTSHTEAMAVFEKK